METLVEQRQAQRTNIRWPVSVWLPQAKRFFNGHSSNVSKTGAFLQLPITIPLRPGHIIEMNFPRTTELARRKGCYARIKRGRVVRVERGNILKDASIGVGVIFE